MPSRRDLERRADDLADSEPFAPYGSRADAWRAFLRGDLSTREYYRLVGFDPDRE